MSDGLTIGATLNEPTIFECPNCKETIDAKAEACRFCGAKVDRDAALQSAVALAKINRACSDASYMRSTTFTLPVFFGLRFVPFIALVGSIGFAVLLWVIPIWALRWWRKYAGIVTLDSDFLKARRTVMLIGIFVPILLVVFIIAPSLLGILIALHGK